MIFGLAVLLFALLPAVIRSEYMLNLLLMFFLYVIIAQSWNLLGGFTGQVSLGHSAFFGTGALITRLLWTAGLSHSALLSSPEVWVPRCWQPLSAFPASVCAPPTFLSARWPSP